MPLGTRTRVIPLPFPTEGRAATNTYSWWVPSNYDTAKNDYLVWTYLDNAAAVSHLVGYQITESQNHPAWRSRKPGRFDGDMGGPFLMRKRECTVPYGKVRISGSNMDYTNPWSYRDGNFTIGGYEGAILPCNPNQLQWPPYSSSSLDDLQELGTTAIARCSPSTPAVDLSTMLGEIVKDGIPKIYGATLKKWRDAPPSQVRKDLGGEYLNHEFGWKPLVNDLMDLSQSIVDADAVWRQYERDANKMVRRRFEFPVFESKKFEQVYSTNPYLVGPESSVLYNFRKTNIGRCIREHTLTRRQWFSGAFKYYLPTGDSSYGLIDLGIPGRKQVAEHVIRAKKLLGITLTPDTVWNLAPWSWAVDWFSNTGDIATNWSNWAIDGQVLMYGYMMEHTVSSYTYTWVGDTYFRSAVVVPSVTLTSETKQRVKAGPYGFGSSYDGLSDRQLAIATALGASRAK